MDGCVRLSLVHQTVFATGMDVNKKSWVLKVSSASVAEVLKKKGRKTCHPKLKCLSSLIGTPVKAQDLLPTCNIDHQSFLSKKHSMMTKPILTSPL